MLSKFKSFEYDYLLESINESMLYFSPRMRNQLKSTDHKIAKELLDAEGKNSNTEATFIDIDPDEEGKVTFINMNHARQYLSYPCQDLDKVPNIDYSDRLWNYNSSVYKGNRNSIKIGKLINKILTNKYSPRDIEIFTNEFKSKSYTNKEVISLVSGKDIEHWYDKENYLSEFGSLGNSCMSESWTKNFFKIYTENPESCSMLIMTIGDKLVARALVWKIDTVKGRNRSYQIPDDIKNIKYFMDRVYYAKDYQEVKLINYAKENGWAYNRGHSGVRYNGSDWDLDLTVKIKPGDYQPYPYLDTFCRYDAKKGILYNDNDREKIGHILRSTEGSYRPSISRTRATLNKIKNFKDFF